MNRPAVNAVLLMWLVMVPAAADADLSIKSKGELGLESRVFFPDGDGDAYNIAMVGRLTVDAKARPFRMRLRGFGRHDGVDQQRSTLFPEEAWLEYKKNPFRLRVGYQMLNWTATEAFHPADIINSRYFDGNLQNPEKRGELMAAARLKFLDGNAEAYFMPLFAEPILPSPNSRFRLTPLGFFLGRQLIIDQSGQLSDDRWFPQWGLRVQQSVGGADIGLHVVQHIDRSLPLVVADPATGDPRLAFQHLTQVGGTYQHVVGEVIIKVEGAYRWFTNADDDVGAVPDRDHALIAAGVEWGIGHESGGESTFLAEAQHAFGLNDAAVSLLLFEGDGLLGYRYDHGDESGQTVTVSAIVDFDQPEQIFGVLEYARRLGETWKVSTGIRQISFPPVDPDNPVGPETLHNANYVFANLTRYF